MQCEELVIRKAQNKEPEAFKKIVEEYKGMVYAICFNIIKNHHEAENLVQETFITVYQSLSEYKFKGFKSWIGRIATNKALDLKRTARYKNEHKILNLDDVPECFLQEEKDFDDRLVKSEKSQILKEICRELPLEYSSIIRKFYLESKSYIEVSNEEGIAIKTVESRLYRARQAIREKWKEVDQ